MLLGTKVQKSFFAHIFDSCHYVVGFLTEDPITCRTWSVSQSLLFVYMSGIDLICRFAAYRACQRVSIISSDQSMPLSVNALELKTYLF